MTCFILPAIFCYNPNRTILLFTIPDLGVCCYTCISQCYQQFFSSKMYNERRGRKRTCKLFRHCLCFNLTTVGYAVVEIQSRNGKQNLNQNKACFQGLACSQQLVRLNMHFNLCLTFLKKM